MNQSIIDLSDELHELYKEIMKANPWDEGYGEVVAIHEFLLSVLRDKAQKSFAEFQKFLEQAAKDIEEKWTSNSSHLAKWSNALKPVFEKVELIIANSVPLLALL